MTTVYHPTLDASYEVEDDKVPNWQASGWLLASRETPVEPREVQATRPAKKAAKKTAPKE